MKKLFVSSAVFAAGTLASFAAVNFTDADGETWNFANDWETSSKVLTSYSSNGSSCIFKESADTITGSWMISFNLSKSGTDNEGKYLGLVSTKTWTTNATPGGYILLYNRNSNTLGFGVHDNEGSSSRPEVYLADVNLSEKISFSYIETDVSGYGFFVISNGSNSVASSLINTGTNANLTYDSWGTSVSRFWSRSGRYQFSNIALSYSDEIPTTVIPEPSMFGLFAGLGVLGFAGTRRRRK